MSNTDPLSLAEQRRRLELYNDFVIKFRHDLEAFKEMGLDPKCIYNEDKDCYELVFGEEPSHG